jgi:antitoxin component YwqK of YwqJK toxin-antitoxin module
MALPYIYVQNVNAKSHTEYFSDSLVQVKVELKNGFKNGSYTEYHDNGEVKMTGEFKNDKRDGTWRLYDETGKLILKRRYEEGEISKEKVKD